MAGLLKSWVQSGHLTGLVHAAAKAAFTALLRAHPDQRFYAFALFTDDSLQFLHPIANSEEALAATVQRYREHVDEELGTVSTDTSLRWSYGDWGFFPEANANAGSSPLDEINAELNANFNADDDDDELTGEEWNATWNAIRDGLRRLDAEGFFGTGADRAQVTLLLAGDLSEDLTDAWVGALNPPDVAKRYLQWDTADLKQAVLLHEQVFIERGYRRSEALERGPTYADGARRFIMFDSMRGQDLRCVLGDGPVPTGRACFEIEGESPSWRTEHGETVSSAVAAAIAFLLESGFSFLDDPLRLTPTAWREQHGILVRDSRRRVIRFSAPPDMTANRVIMACIRTHPAMRGKSAMTVRGILGTDMKIPPVRETLAFAIELQQRCQAEGLVVTISE